MNKFFKLLYVNVLALFDINKIKVAREDGVKSNLEIKGIIMAIIAIFYGYLLYKLFVVSNITNKINILSMGFAISSIFCLVIDISLIEPIIFKNEDNEMLFSLPLSKYQIVFSKLFSIYLRNLIFVIIIMASALIGYLNFIPKISDDFTTMYIIGSLFIPFIPIVIATIFAYINSFLKVKFINNKIYYYIIKILVFSLLIIGLFLIFRKANVSSVNEFIQMFLNKMNFIYPMNFFFYLMLRDENVLFFLLVIIIPIFFIYAYSFLISNNYLRICSMLKGVKRKVSFKYKKTLNLRVVLGMVRKEIINLFANKVYLLNSFSILLIISVGLFIGLRIVDIDKFKMIEDFDLYLHLYCPTILAMCATFNIMAISAMSLEKSNMHILRTMPIRMSQIIFSKWLTNVLLNSLFIVINAFTIWLNISKDMPLLIWNILLPLIALMFVTLTAIVIDYRFICKNETNDNVIIKQRLVTLLPTFLSFVIGIAPFFVPANVKYNLELGSYVFLFIILMGLEIIYLIINRKKLLRGLFS